MEKILVVVTLYEFMNSGEGIYLSSEEEILTTPEAIVLQ